MRTGMIQFGVAWNPQIPGSLTNEFLGPTLQRSRGQV